MTKVFQESNEGIDRIEPIWIDFSFDCNQIEDQVLRFGWNSINVKINGNKTKLKLKSVATPSFHPDVVLQWLDD